jgi:uncharacterized protein (TIGR03437 family)
MKVLMRTLLTGLAVCFTLPPAYAAVTYSRFLNLGTNGYTNTTVTAMTTDVAGNVYLTGATSAANFPATSGVLQPVLGPGTCSYVFDPHSPPIMANCSDAFVIKLDPNGNVLFATYLGGTGTDSGQSIAVDAQGAIYVAGSTIQQSGGLNNFPVTPGAAFTTESSGQWDAFVAKLNPSGTALIYSTLIPNGGQGTVAGLAVDSAGNVYFGGGALPSQGAFPTTSGAFQSAASIAATSPNSNHCVVAKLNAAGSALLYSTYVGGTNSDYFGGLAIDSSGNVYITGTTFSHDYPVTPGAFQTTSTDSVSAAFVTKLNATGSALVYSTYLGGSSVDGATAIRVDSQGDALIIGQSESTNFPVTTGAFENNAFVAPWAIVGYSRFFLARFNPQGTSLLYATLFDGASYLDSDAAGNAYIAGNATYGFPTTSGATQRCAAGGYSDALLTQLNPQGTLAAASYLGGSGADLVSSVSVGADGSVYVVGNTMSTDFPGNTQLIGAITVGSSLPFIVKMKISDPTQPDTPCMALVAQNGASFAEGGIAPGELITLRGLGFGPDAGVNANLSLSTPVPQQLSNVQVLFDGVPAPLLYVQSQQINVQAPWELSGRAVTKVQVNYQGALSNIATVPIVAAAPALFVQTYGQFQAAALNADGTINSPANPAKRGSYVSIWGTGGGATNLPGVTGGYAPLSPLAMLTQTVTANLTGANATVLFAGAAPTLISGVFQVNLAIPANLEAGISTWNVNMFIGGVSDQPVPVTIAVQ